MFLRLFLLFTLLPVAELWILVRMGGWLGVGPTLALVVATGAAGAWLARREGVRAWLDVQSEIAGGRLPTDGLTHAMLILVAGVVLLTPGVITDVAGLLLLLAPVRKGLIARLRAGFRRRIEEGTITVVGGPGPMFGGGFGPRRPDPQGRDATARGAGYPNGREIIVDADSSTEG
ncbi:MAG: FxsA family protein [Gemmatimonadetes bacterium]|nr:FxsA family protein [Gemmatimonadota bacterium]